VKPTRQHTLSPPRCRPAGRHPLAGESWCRADHLTAWSLATYLQRWYEVETTNCTVAAENSSASVPRSPSSSPTNSPDHRRRRCCNWPSPQTQRSARCYSSAAKPTPPPPPPAACAWKNPSSSPTSQDSSASPLAAGDVPSLLGRAREGVPHGGGRRGCPIPYSPQVNRGGGLIFQAVSHRDPNRDVRERTAVARRINAWEKLPASESRLQGRRTRPRIIGPPLKTR